MASLGTVQAVLDIDVGKAIASLTSLGKKAKDTGKDLESLGKAEKEFAAAAPKFDISAAPLEVAAKQLERLIQVYDRKKEELAKAAEGSIRYSEVSSGLMAIERDIARVTDNINASLGKIGLKFDARSLFNGNGFTASSLMMGAESVGKKYIEDIDAMLQKNKALSLLPESWRKAFATIIAEVDGFTGRIRKGTSLHEFAKENLGYEDKAPLAVAAMTKATEVMQKVGAIGSFAAAGFTLVGKAALGAVAGVVGFANALKLAYKVAVNRFQHDPTLDLFQRAEAYESALRKISVQAEGEQNGLTRTDYDSMAREFSKYANVTRTEALEVAKSLSLVGNIGQSFGNKIRKGTEIGKEAIADINKASQMLVDFTALRGGDTTKFEDIKKQADNLRIAFSSWDNFQELTSHVALFTEEQQKAIEKTKAMKGEAAALNEAFSYLPENLAGINDKSLTPLEKAWGDLRANVRSAWDGIADDINWEGISEKLAGLFGDIGTRLSEWLSGASEWVAPMMEGLANGIIDGVQWVVDAFSGIKDAVWQVFADIANNSAVQSFVEGFSSLIESLGERFRAFMDSSLVEGFAGGLQLAAEGALNLGGAIMELASVAVDFAALAADFLHLDDILGGVIYTIGGLIGIIGDLVSMAVDGWKLIIEGAQNLWNVVASQEAWGQLGKGISNAIDWFADLYNKAVGFVNGIKTAIANMFSAAGQVLGFVKDRAHQAAAAAGERVKTAAASIGDSPDAGSKIAAVTAEVDKMNRAVESNTKAVTDNKKALKTWTPSAGGGGGGRRRGGGGGGKSDADKQADRDAKNADRYLKSLREQAQEINRLTKLERLRYDIETGAINLTDEQLEQARKFAEIIDNRVRLQRQERIEIELATQALSYRREAEDAGLRVADVGAQMTMPDRLFTQMQELRGMALEYQRQIEDLQLRERQDLIGKSAEEAAEIANKYRVMTAMAESAYQERVKFWQMEVDAVEQFSHDIGANYKKGLLEVADWYSKLGKDIQSATTSWANKTADALAGFVRKGKLDFKSLADSILDDLARIASQQFVSAIAGGFTGGWTSGGGGGGGGFFSGIWNAIKGIFGFASGGYTGAGGKHEPAGIVHAGEFVINAASTRRLVDEFGWDFLKKLNGYSSGGYVTPLPSIVKSGGNGGIVHDADIEVNIYNQTDGQVTTRRNKNGWLDVFIKQAVDAVAADIAMGGAVASAMQGTYALNRGYGVQRRGF